MPNHVTHRLHVTAPTKEKLDEFLAGIRSAEGAENATDFDFERLIPMPESLRDTESSSLVDVGLIIIGRADILGNCILSNMPKEDAYLFYPWVMEAGVKTKEELREYLRERSPTAEEAGRKALRAYEETGSISWYEWCLANWGVKWNAYSIDLERQDDTSAILVFDTAWSIPEPIFDAIASAFPDIKLVGHCFDEGYNFAATITIAGGGSCVEVGEATDDIYEKVYGCKPEFEDEEEAA